VALEEGEKCECQRVHEGDEEEGEGEGGESEDGDEDDEDEEDVSHGDPWIRGIDTCTGCDEPTHVHVRIPGNEKSGKRRFF
jgi:hypothetical protein